jgi:NAD-dependent deacetylase
MHDLSAARSIVILTGAGISAASGLATFRDRDGIWAKYDYREVATPEGFARNPDRVQQFYNFRRREALKAEPNPAHSALARLDREWKGDFLLVTQNVDGLHERAGSRRLLHMHGELNSALCLECGRRHAWTSDIELDTVCPACSRAGGMRPDIVWFGEIPYHMDEIGTALDRADLFLSIGTSGTVYPAAGFAEMARHAGARAIEINLEASGRGSIFDECITGQAVETVPAFVDRLLAAGPIKRD